MFITTLVVLLRAWLNHNTMEDLQLINDIVNQSTKEASYWSVVISSTVFIIYTIINKVIELYKAKDKNKPMLEMASAIKQVSENVVKLNAVLDKTFKETERKESHKCKQVIDLAFRNFASHISQECEDIITHNNIEKNKEFITDNITKLVSTEYYKLYSILSSYEINEVNVASKLKEDWIKEVADNMIAIIYDGQEAISRINQLNNRLFVYIGEYSTYINNKTFNT